MSLTIQQRLQVLQFVAKAQADMLREIAHGKSWNAVDYWDAMTFFAGLVQDNAE